MAHRVEGLWDSANARWQTTQFSYNAQGLVAERRERIRIGSSTPWDLFTYIYNRAGMLTADRVTVGSHTLRHQYQYDRRGLLTTVGISHATTGSFSQILALDYDIAGAVTERQLGTQTSVPYAYDVAGRIHEIGDVTSTSDPFAALYSYTPSGLIARMDTRSGAAAQDCPYSSGVCTDYWRYNFSYDGLARLTTAQYQPMGGHMRGPGYSVSNLSYDSQGNIETLTRNAPTMPHPEGTAVDQLSYTYTARTNRLASVVDAVTTDLDWDAKPSTFQYNRVGSMTRMTEALGTGLSRITDVQVYDERQLPEELHVATHAFPTSDTLFVRYRYDANGQRISKWVSGSGQTERYVRDGMRLIGVFDENNELKSWNIGGAAGLVGRAIPDPRVFPPEHVYYVADHLGSIRAVINQSGTVIEGRDYYPYGLTMPGRFYVEADTTREGFTGHELDKETGDYYAGARYYGPALGRWFVVDPMVEAYPGWSPYNYTMGNPAMFIDPDGMETDDDVDQVSAPRTTENFYPEDMFVYGMRNHPGARTPIVRVWVDGPSDQGTATNGDDITHIFIGYTKAKGHVIHRQYHAFVVAVDPSTGEHYITRAGPSSDSVLGSASNLASSAAGGSISASDGDGSSGGMGLGYLRASHGIWNALSEIDSFSETIAIQHVGTLNTPYTSVVSSMIEFSNITNQNRLPYSPFGQGTRGANSNSYAFTFIESLGLSRPNPQLSSPGWRAGRPSSQLTRP